MKDAQIISIGDELLIGDTINTNAAVIGSFLSDLGFSVKGVQVLPDSREPVYHAVRHSLETYPLTITTGGLGPTHDDITKRVVAELFESSWVRDENVLEHIARMFKERGYKLGEVNRQQADVPDVSEVLFNKKGTAPGLWFKKNNHFLAILPGVPHEMAYLLENGVKEKIRENFPVEGVRISEYYKSAGVPESELSGRVGDLSRYIGNGVDVAYLPHAGGVNIRISTHGSNGYIAGEKLKALQTTLRDKVGNVIYARGRESQLAEVVGGILDERNLTIAVAESCTGGLLANKITDIPGCASYMKGSITAYCNKVKIKLLNVNPSALEKHGAVSKLTALQMAEGVAKKLGSDIGVSTTGIAGPGGGTPEKPVGLVWMGFWIMGDHFALRGNFSEDRLINKERTATVVLETLRRYFNQIDEMPYHLKPQRL